MGNIHPKVTAAAIAGAVVTVLVYGFSTFANIKFPPDVVAAFTTIVSFAAGYLTSA